MSEEKEIKKEPGKISRRQFLRDAGIVVGGTAVSSAFFLSACGEEVEVTKTVTTTAPGATSTVTTTAPGATSTVTKTAADNTVTVTKYTCPVCNQEFDSLESLKAHYDSEHGDSADRSIITLIINEHEYILKVEPNWTLEYVLREKLRLTGCKTFCKGGACGSCTIILNGRPILSCMLLAVECDNKQIETIEGIANMHHPLINAYADNECAQCGYCTPGFVVTAKALLDRNPNPSPDDIKRALAGNLCRCGTYPQHVPAVLEAAKIKRGEV